MTTGPGRSTSGGYNFSHSCNHMLCLPVGSKEANVHSKDLSKCSMQRMLAAFIFGMRGFKSAVTQ